MYNQDVIDRLNNLTNLYALKNANIKVISKKNSFGDVVKFFAQINTENIIQRITYKASGCSTFMALCSYFCEIVEGKTIDKTLKINEADLEKFSKLEESKTHVYKIILDTFALLIKKYKTGVQKGKIIPCEPLNNNVEVIKKSKKTSKKNDNMKAIIDINDNYLIDAGKKKSKKTKKAEKIEQPSQLDIEKKTKSASTKVAIENKSEKKDNSVRLEKLEKPVGLEHVSIQASTKSEKTEKTIEIMPEEVIVSEIKPKITRKKTTKIVKDIPNNQVTTTTIEIVSTESVETTPDTDSVVISNENQKKALEHAKILEKSTYIAQIQNEKNKQKDEANKMKLSHLNALSDRIKNKETNEKMKSNSDNLNNLLNKFKTTNTLYSANNISSNNTIDNADNNQKTDKNSKKKDKKESKKELKNNEQNEKKKEIQEDKTNKEGKKKSLFSWFRK